MNKRPTEARSHTQGLIVLASCVVLVAGGLIGVDRLFADDARDPSPDIASDRSTPSASASASASATAGSLTVSGLGVGKQRFGADEDQAIVAVTARLGKPDLVLEPQRYVRIPGHAGWFEDAQDPTSLGWQYPVMSITCWGQLCLMFGGDDPDTLRLRGWELAPPRGRAGDDTGVNQPHRDVRLSGSGIRLGDNWKQLHAAYPGTEVGRGEGWSLLVVNTPWEGVFDGVGQWRLSGVWDNTLPIHAPPAAKVTRLSGGDGPEPGCC